jgi:hypothetical protein
VTALVHSASHHGDTLDVGLGLALAAAIYGVTMLAIVVVANGVEHGWRYWSWSWRCVSARRYVRLRRDFGRGYALTLALGFSGIGT